MFSNEELGSIIMMMPFVWVINLLVGLFVGLLVSRFMRVKWLAALAAVVLAYGLMVLLGVRIYDMTTGNPGLWAVNYFGAAMMMLEHPLYFTGMVLIPQAIAFLLAKRTSSWRAALVQVTSSIVLSTLITLAALLCTQPSILRLVFGPDEMSRGL